MRMYKVVKRLGERLVSSWAEGEARVVYTPGQPARAPSWLAEHGYHITVFISLDDARAYKRDVAERQIWEAEATGPLMPPPHRL